MSDVETVFGIDLGTTYSCIAYVDEYGKSTVLPNSEGDYITPSVVQFEGDERYVGKIAKSNALLTPLQVVEMVKRQMGQPNYRFSYNGIEYTAEEISSYILRKLKDDAEQFLARPVTDVVITCPAYFGIAQREATVKAGQLAGLNVREVINEPTAAAIMYGLQEERDQTVLVYDLGGGTFDVTIIDIKASSITVVATGGDHNLGGRNWDENVIVYLSDKWVEETNDSDPPTNSEETLQHLWEEAEKAKKTLTTRTETKVPVTHAGKRIAIPLTRQKFDELNRALLDRTIEFTRSTIEEARTRGYERFDQILLVGGSSRMPQVEARLKEEFPAIPLRIFDPDQAVAKGAAFYGYKLLIGEKIATAIALMTNKTVEQINIDTIDPTLVEKATKQVAEDEGLVLPAVKDVLATKITNVSSHSFGIVAQDKNSGQDLISNIVLLNDPLPALKTKRYETQEANQETVEFTIMENNVGVGRVENIALGQEIGNAVLNLPAGLPQHAPIDVTFHLQQDGRLHITGCEVRSNTSIEFDIVTSSGLSEEEFQEAKKRSTKVYIS